ncbi:MAG: ComEC/Rec2 family competence protein [Treponema sp.]|nr:ComEC/Rec2 family competence protein [Treponema sp.]
MVARSHSFFSLASTALGAALVFYGFRGSTGLARLSILPVMGVLFFAVLLISLCRALEFGQSPRALRYLRALSRLVVLLSLGFCIGLAALNMEQRSTFAAPLPVQSVQKIDMVMQTDLRLLATGKLAGQAKVLFCEDDRGTRISSHGSVSLFFDASLLQLKDIAGQGSTLYVEGSFSPLQSNMPIFFVKNVMKISGPWGIDRLRFNVRRSILKVLQHELWGAFASALLLGMRDDLEGEFTEMYRRSGSSHVLALSGMHLGIIAGILAFLLRKVLGLRVSAILSLFVLVIYMYIAGFQPSLTRSLIMYVLMLFCFLSGINASLVPIVGLAFLVQLLLDPLGMASLSAMLSYLALAGLVLLSPIFADVLRGIVPRSLGNSLGASLGAFTATAPLVIAVFGVIYPIGIFAGAILSILASFFMIGSIVYLVFHQFIPILCPLVSQILSWTYFLQRAFLHMSSDFSFGLKNLHWVSVCLGSIATALIFVYFQYRGNTARTLSSFN